VTHTSIPPWSYHRNQAPPHAPPTIFLPFFFLPLSFPYLPEKGYRRNSFSLFFRPLPRLSLWTGSPERFPFFPLFPPSPRITINNRNPPCPTNPNWCGQTAGSSPSPPSPSSSFSPQHLKRTPTTGSSMLLPPFFFFFSPPSLFLPPLLPEL